MGQRKGIVLPGALKPITVEFTQGGQHGLGVFSFSTTDLSFHAMVNHGVDTAFNTTTANVAPRDC